MNADLQNMQQILSQVSAINTKYDKIADITGEKFNLFRILKVEAKEVNTHSAILCELLNPRGTHGCKDIFLKLFIEQLKEKKLKEKIVTKLNQFETTGCTVSAEKFVGFINEDRTEGGRIDLLLCDKEKRAIIIENKIFAGDQFQWLVRYNNAYKEAPIFYLTLDGHKPCPESIGTFIEDEDYVCISYKTDIITWLEKCRKEAVTHSILRETITQYINLIKYLTHQTINENMKQEIVKFLAKPENIESANQLLQINRMDVLFEVMEQLVEKIKKLDIANLKVAFDQSTQKLERYYGGFWFYREEWKHCIYFCFDEADEDFNNLYVSIANRTDSDPCENPQKYIKGFNDFVIEHKSNHVPSTNYMWKEEVGTWSSTSWGKILEVMPGVIKDYCEKILQKLEEIDKSNELN